VLDKLEFLLVLAQERHFGRAAEAAGVTQPTFSSAIKSLEETLGTALVERGSRFRGFTPEGERVLEWARRLVGDARTMRQELQSLRGILSGHLHIGAIPTALPCIPHLTVPFNARFPRVRLSVFSATSVDILSKLENLELDIGISYIDNEPVGRLTTVALYEEQYVLLVSCRSPLARFDKMTWSEAGRLPLCLLTPDMQSRRIIDQLLQEAGGGSAPTFESNSMMTLFTHVRTGRWVSIVPARLVDTVERPRQLKTIPLTSPTISKTIGVLVRGREPFAPTVSAFIAVAERAFKASSNVEEPEEA